MVLLTILNGETAGTEHRARRFPFRVGRAATCDLCLAAEGVWDQHLEIQLQPAHGFVAIAQPEAYAIINGQRASTAVLRNGDVIDLGGAQLRFSLSPTRPRNWRLREALTWLALAALCLGQVALIYWLTE